MLDRAAAWELDRLRNNWLNPPEWTRREVLEFPGSVEGPWGRYVEASKAAPPGSDGAAAGNRLPTPRNASRKNGPSALQTSEGLAGLPSASGPDGVEGLPCGTVRYPRVMAKDEACAKELKKRTLTNLYNARPKWLDLAHRKLDEAVFAAYEWPAAMSDEELLAKLLELNLMRAGEEQR